MIMYVLLDNIVDEENYKCYFGFYCYYGKWDFLGLKFVNGGL